MIALILPYPKTQFAKPKTATIGSLCIAAARLRHSKYASLGKGRIEEFGGRVVRDYGSNVAVMRKSVGGSDSVKSLVMMVDVNIEEEEG
ncbi:hypothetical protein HK100_009140, partial [Physocladia obscura]